jgi:hypothetical protein
MKPIPDDVTLMTRVSNALHSDTPISEVDNINMRELFARYGYSISGRETSGK